MVIEQLDRELTKLLKDLPYTKKVEPATIIAQANASLKLTLQDGSVFRIDLHRLPSEKDLVMVDPEIKECVAPPAPPNVGDVYSIWDMEVKVIEAKSDHIAFEEVGQSSPRMAVPALDWHHLAKKV